MTLLKTKSQRSNLIRKIRCLLLVLWGCSAFASQAAAQQQNDAIDKQLLSTKLLICPKGRTLSATLWELERRLDCKVSFDASVGYALRYQEMNWELTQPVSLKTWLMLLLTPYGLDYQIDGKHILIRPFDPRDRLHDLSSTSMPLDDVLDILKRVGARPCLPLPPPEHQTRAVFFLSDGRYYEAYASPCEMRRIDARMEKIYDASN